MSQGNLLLQFAFIVEYVEFVTGTGAKSGLHFHLYSVGHPQMIGKIDCLTRPLRQLIGNLALISLWGTSRGLTQRMGWDQ
jgi:hypothetical protein